MNRDTTIDVLKGIGIILVVIGHSCCPQLLNDFIFSFHMPLFFIASGYFFEMKNLENKKDYLKRKIRGIYLPYLKWSVIFLLLHNFFYYCGILNSSYGNRYGLCSQLYSVKDILHHLLNITLRMTDYEGFILGAYWFMRSLFVGCLLLCFGTWAMNKVIKSRDRSIAVVMAIFFIAGGVMTYFSIQVPYFPQGGYREVMAVFFIGCGYFIRQKNNWLCRSYIVLPSLIILILCTIVSPTSMSSKATFDDWLAIAFTGIGGFVVTYFVSKQIAKFNNEVSRSLVHIGRNSFYILTFHFLMFKPASLLYAYIYDLDWHIVGCHPVPTLIDENWFWIVFSISSIVFSLLLTEVLKSLRTE